MNTNAQRQYQHMRKDQASYSDAYQGQHLQTRQSAQQQQYGQQGSYANSQNGRYAANANQSRGYSSNGYRANQQAQVRYDAYGNQIVFDAQGRPVRRIRPDQAGNAGYYNQTQGNAYGQYPYGQAYAQQEANPYSRDAADGTAYAKGKKKKGKHRKLKIVSIILAVLLVVAVGGFFAYYQMLKNNMSYKGDWTDLLNALTKADYEEPFYVLVIGSDNWEDQGARADAMVLVRVDLNTPQLTMVTIPRDTPYTYADGTTFKLNSVFENQGLVPAIEAVSKVAGVPIADYIEVEFDGLEEVVDSLGGITVDVPYEFWYTVYTGDQPTVHVEAGEQTLTGEQAVALARMRTAYTDKLGNGFTDDTIRQLNIRNMMSAILKKVLSGSITDLPAKVTALSNMVTTDIPLETLIQWATKVYKSSGLKVYSVSAPYAGTLYNYGQGEVFLTYDDPEAWSQLMDVVDSGIDPTKVITTNTNSDGTVKDGSSVVISTGD